MKLNSQVMHSYIVMVSPSYGGAEKRFFDIFTSLRRSGSNIFFIAPSSLLDQLKIDHGDRADVFPALISIDLEVWSRFEFIRKFGGLLKQLPLRSCYHYPLNCLWPLHIGRSDRVTMSVADCTNVPRLLTGARTSIWTWISFFFTSKIDVLSPAVFSALQDHFRADRMSLTPGGTYIIPVDSAKLIKIPLVVFIGRLVPLKGIEDFLDILPELWSFLKKVSPIGFQFQIAGYGSLEEVVSSRVKSLAYSGIPISFIGYSDSAALLDKAAIALSLQEVTNYPSRVVAEALLAGCGVIVRDTGDSRKFGEDLPGLIYCRSKLNSVELADLISPLLDRILSNPEFSDEVRSAAVGRFSAGHYITYFRELICLNA